MTDQERQAIIKIKSYYDHKIDLETLHSQLLKIFESQKVAFEFLYNTIGGYNA